LSEVGISPTFERLMLEFDDLEMKNVVSELDDNERRSAPRGDLKKDLRDFLQSFRDDQTQRQNRSRSAAPGPQPRNEQDDLDALRHLIEHERNRQGISRPTDG
jgi:hypothetical protein